MRTTAQKRKEYSRSALKNTHVKNTCVSMVKFEDKCAYARAFSLISVLQMDLSKNNAFRNVSLGKPLETYYFLTFVIFSICGINAYVTKTNIQVLWDFVIKGV